MNKKITWGLIVTGLIAFSAIYSKANAFNCFCNREEGMNSCIQVFDKNVKSLDACVAACKELQVNRKLNYTLKASETKNPYLQDCEKFENVK